MVKVVMRVVLTRFSSLCVWKLNLVFLLGRCVMMVYIYHQTSPNRNDIFTLSTSTAYGYNFLFSSNFTEFLNLILIHKSIHICGWMNILFQLFQETSFKIKISKKETMIWNWYECNDRALSESIIKIQNEKILKTKYFENSNVWIRYNSLSIGYNGFENRIFSGRGSFGLKCKLLQIPSINLKYIY